MSTWKHLDIISHRETDAASSASHPLDGHTCVLARAWLEKPERVVWDVEWGGRRGQPSDVSSDGYTWGQPDAATPRQAGAPKDAGERLRHVLLLRTRRAAARGGNVKCPPTGAQTETAFSQEKVLFGLRRDRTGRHWRLTGSCRCVTPEADAQREESSARLSDWSISCWALGPPERQSSFPLPRRVPAPWGEPASRLAGAGEGAGT